MIHWCGTCCAIIMIRLPRNVDVLAVLVIGSFLTWIFCSCYFLFFFFHFWFLSLGFIFWKKLFWENFFEKSRATKIIFRTKFKITSKLFSVFISNSTVLFTGHVTLFNLWHPKNDLFRFRTTWNMFKQSKFKIIFKLNFW